jgi:hypothetical protein
MEIMSEREAVERTIKVLRDFAEACRVAVETFKDFGVAVPTEEEQ